MTSKLKKLATEVVKYQNEWDDKLAIAIDNLADFLRYEYLKEKMQTDLSHLKQMRSKNNYGKTN
jgi:hypothetical protein